MYREIERDRKKRKSHIPKASANVIKFCEILDSLPIDFTFKLNDVSKEFDGSWKKKVSNGTTGWWNGPRVLYNSSFFPIRTQVLEAIENEGWPVRKLYSSDVKIKRIQLLTKEKVQALYYREKKSLEEIGNQYGYTRQWIMLLMKKYGLRRRTRSKARIEAIKQGRG